MTSENNFTGQRLSFTTMSPKNRKGLRWSILAGILTTCFLALIFNSHLLAAFGAMNGVKTLDPEGLLQISNGNEILLVDVREKREFEVSHLRGAEWVEGLNWQEVDKNTPIVLYCTIGFRSTEWGTTLAKQGFRNLYNLDGGIVRWKNEKRTVFNQKNQPTDSVHVYSDLFGFLLREGQAVE